MYLDAALVLHRSIYTTKVPYHILLDYLENVKSLRPRITAILTSNLQLLNGTNSLRSVVITNKITIYYPKHILGKRLLH